MTPEEWTDADPSGLRAAWRDGDNGSDECDRCGRDTERDGARLCEPCARQVRLRR